jgi:hypothetical protein
MTLFHISSEVSLSNKHESLKVLSQIYISLIPALHVCSQALLTKLLLLFTGKQTVISESEINIIDQYSERKVESSIVNGTDGDNSNKYGSNQIVSNSNSEENLLYFNDTSVNSNHVVIDVTMLCFSIKFSNSGYKLSLFIKLQQFT